ncbi:MAG: MBL fold metallo-hydrolase [Clostridiales bacterium]|nr:MBL fold metallo-hydrolase [Clostridiales bacterium]
MKLTFLGAAHEVTGSRFLLEACGKNIMIDYGMEQGSDLYENTPLPMTEGSLDAVLLTHAHIDHSGYLPLLYKNGFRGHVYATEPTTDLCKIMLLDSAHIQESDAEYKNRKNQRSGKPLVEPLYTQEHALGVHSQFMPCRYNDSVDIFDGITIRMVDVGHLLGSAAIEVTVREGDDEKILVFSGDIGNIRQPLLRDPIPMHRADYVIMESTYGDRTHGPTPDYIGNLTEIIQSTLDKGGNVVIPSFAVGRTQELLYFIRHIKQNGLIKGHDHFPVYVDSPLAVEATNVFKENTYECADEETLELLKQGINPIACPDLHLSITADDSKALNVDKEPKVIISSSGMCDAGRIRHHLKHNLWRPECTVLFVGYQSNGTLGRSLVDGAKQVKLFGEPIEVNARIDVLAGKSGHADQNGLINWVNAFSPKPKQVFVVHGEDGVTDTFAKLIADQYGHTAVAPYNGESWDLTNLRKLNEGNRQRIQKMQKEVAAADAQPANSSPSHQEKSQGSKQQKKQENVSQTYAQLLVAMDKLQDVVERMKNRSRKDQGKLTNYIYNLIRRFGKK